MRINGIGCSLIDNLYTPVDFNSTSYKKWTEAGGIQNGIITGGLIFGDDLETSSGIPYSSILDEVTGGGIIPSKNIGGPGVVAVIHISQILNSDGHEIGFIGSRGTDLDGEYLSRKLGLFNIDSSNYITATGHTPFTDVLADPDYNCGNGERSFINYIGAAGEMSTDMIPSSFFEADILIFGGTGLTPKIHDDLSILLRKGKLKGAINCVNTVYDFRNQKKDPAGPWPLVSERKDFGLIDLLITDNEEALRISGCDKKSDAATFFMEAGTGSVIITHGEEDIICCSDGRLFTEENSFTIPVSAKAGNIIRNTPAGEADTTGCGDNFAGGVYASVIRQIERAETNGKPSLKKAAAFGAVSGGFAGQYLGGVFYEKNDGEKLAKILPLLRAYEKQTGESYAW